MTRWPPECPYPPQRGGAPLQRWPKIRDVAVAWVKWNFIIISGQVSFPPPP